MLKVDLSFYSNLIETTDHKKTMDEFDNLLEKAKGIESIGDFIRAEYRKIENFLEITGVYVDAGTGMAIFREKALVDLLKFFADKFKEDIVIENKLVTFNNEKILPKDLTFIVQYPYSKFEKEYSSRLVQWFINNKIEAKNPTFNHFNDAGNEVVDKVIYQTTDGEKSISGRAFQLLFEEIDHPSYERQGIPADVLRVIEELSEDNSSVLKLSMEYKSSKSKKELFKKWKKELKGK